MRIKLALIVRKVRLAERRLMIRHIVRLIFRTALVTAVRFTQSFNRCALSLAEIAIDPPRIQTTHGVTTYAGSGPVADSISVNTLSPALVRQYQLWIVLSAYLKILPRASSRQRSSASRSILLLCSLRHRRCRVTPLHAGNCGTRRPSLEGSNLHSHPIRFSLQTAVVIHRLVRHPDRRSHPALLLLHYMPRLMRQMLLLPRSQVNLVTLRVRMRLYRIGARRPVMNLHISHRHAGHMLQRRPVTLR